MKREEIIAKWAELGARERDAWVEDAILPIGEDEARDRRKFRSPRPHYTTDNSAAWAVFEHFPYIETARIPGRPITYGVRINGLDGSVRAMTQEATFPEAVSLAALIAELTEVPANEGASI